MDYETARKKVPFSLFFFFSSFFIGWSCSSFFFLYVQFVEMGFSYAAAALMLQWSEGDVNSAMNLLLTIPQDLLTAEGGGKTMFFFLIFFL